MKKLFFIIFFVILFYINAQDNTQNEDYKTHIETATAFLEIDKTDSAIEEFDKAIKLDPSKGDAYSGKGNAYLKKKDYKNAILNYTLSLGISKTEKDYKNRANAYYNLGKFAEAAADYEECIKLNSTYYFYYAMRGNCYFYLKKIDDAKRDYGNALNLITDKNGRNYQQINDNLKALGVKK